MFQRRRIHVGEEKARGNKKLGPIATTRLFYAVCMHRAVELFRATSRKGVPRLHFRVFFQSAPIRITRDTFLPVFRKLTHSRTDTLRAYVPEIRPTCSRSMTFTLQFSRFADILRRIFPANIFEKRIVAKFKLYKRFFRFSIDVTKEQLRSHHRPLRNASKNRR